MSSGNTTNCTHGKTLLHALGGGAPGGVAVGRVEHEQRLHEHVRWGLPHKLAHQVLQPLQPRARLTGARLCRHAWWAVACGRFAAMRDLPGAGTNPAYVTPPWSCCHLPAPDPCMT